MSSSTYMVSCFSLKKKGGYVIEKVTCLVKPSETARIAGPSRIVDDVAVDTALINFSDSLDSRSSPLPQDSWLKIESKTFGFQRSLICTKSRFGIESYQGNPNLRSCPSSLYSDAAKFFSLSLFLILIAG